jgi:PIN domain nuclease of toxin-antitoxin system
VRVLLDTCAWLWDAATPERLSDAAARAIRDSTELHLSVISCWEIAKLVEKGKLHLSIPVRDWTRRALARERLVLAELTPDICIESTELPHTMPGDPADQIIVATARRLSVPIVTSDRRIAEYPGVQTVW